MGGTALASDLGAAGSGPWRGGGILCAREWTQVPPSSAPRPGLVSFLGRHPDPSDKAMAALEGTSGFPVRSAKRCPEVGEGGDSWQEWLGAGAKMTLQRECLTTLRSPCMRVGEESTAQGPASHSPHNLEGREAPQEEGGSSPQARSIKLK